MKDLVKSGKDVVKNNGAEGIAQQGTGDLIGDGFGGGQRSVVKI